METNHDEVVIPRGVLLLLLSFHSFIGMFFFTRRRRHKIIYFIVTSRSAIYAIVNCHLTAAGSLVSVCVSAANSLHLPNRADKKATMMMMMTKGHTKIACCNYTARTHGCIMSKQLSACIHYVLQKPLFDLKPVAKSIMLEFAFLSFNL